jgi:hypothetical protein
MRLYPKLALIVATAFGLALVGLGCPPAQAANFSQNWSSSQSFRASIDFIPSGGSITLYGSACRSNSGANQFDEELLRTFGSQIIWTSDFAPADGQAWNLGTASVSPGNAHYIRWRGAISGVFYFPAPCQHVGATPVQ